MSNGRNRSSHFIELYPLLYKLTSEVSLENIKHRVNKALVAIQGPGVEYYDVTTRW